MLLSLLDDTENDQSKCVCFVQMHSVFLRGVADTNNDTSACERMPSSDGGSQASISTTTPTTTRLVSTNVFVTYTLDEAAWACLASTQT